MWYVYLLLNEVSGVSYVGCTTNYKKRIRQHNGDIVGGARATRKWAGHWRLYKVLEGFKDRSEAMRWERILKMRGRGIEGRSEAFDEVSKGRCPKPGKHYDVPSTIKFVPEGLL